MASYAKAILQALASGPKLTRQISAEVQAGNIYRCLNMLHKRGFISKGEGCYSILDKGRKGLAGEVAMPSGGPCSQKAMSRQTTTLRDRAWRSMRQRDFFSLDDLLTLLCDESNARTAGDNLASWLHSLSSAGYIVQSARNTSRDSRYTRRYRLVRNTGPLAPAWNKAKRTLTDPNTGEQHIIPAGRNAMA